MWFMYFPTPEGSCRVRRRSWWESPGCCVENRVTPCPLDRRSMHACSALTCRNCETCSKRRISIWPPCRRGDTLNMEQVNTAADSRGNPGGGEARVKMCRSLMMTLQRAAEVLGEVRAREVVWRCARAAGTALFALVSK